MLSPGARALRMHTGVCLLLRVTIRRILCPAFIPFILHSKDPTVNVNICVCMCRTLREKDKKKVDDTTPNLTRFKRMPVCRTELIRLIF